MVQKVSTRPELTAKGLRETLRRARGVSDVRQEGRGAGKQNGVWAGGETAKKKEFFFKKYHAVAWWEGGQEQSEWRFGVKGVGCGEPAGAA